MGHERENESYRRKAVRVRVVTDGALADPVFLADVKTFAGRLRIPRRRFIDWLIDGFRDANAVLVDEHGTPVWIDFDEIERDHIDLWFRDWCKVPEDQVRPRVRAESRERIRLVATLLRAIFPKESTVWGQPVLMC